MVRAVTFVVFSLALLGLVSSELLPCSDEPRFKKFFASASNAELVDADGLLRGRIVWSMDVSRANRHCYLGTFTTLEEVGLLKLRAGLFPVSDRRTPTGKDRFPRKKRVPQVEGKTVHSADITICPRRIKVQQLASCCGYPTFDLYAFAVVSVNGGAPERVYMTQENANSSCRTPDAKKPFRQICSIAYFCNIL
ncbi:hypothetical protein NDN08_002132 [Rhodosorus marinus]|uniref:Uncharacterized protein n=1 Tax=Rhodosorus marinus TaxID=101924 RepID=A0AAV8UVS2_9RHOD|nr:hypothetical protein NDN08_002132 [Rhodosorus marinus]